MLFRHHALVGAVALFSVVALPAVAQIVPDDTLGNEGSILMGDVEVRGDLADLVEGGATRGGNLFHSFLEFGSPKDVRIAIEHQVNIAFSWFS